MLKAKNIILIIITAASVTALLWQARNLPPKQHTHAWAQSTPFPQQASNDSFLRYVEQGAVKSKTGRIWQRAQLQTSISRYVRKDGKVVDLIGAVHVADKSYYQKLNTRFQSYDTVLVELVGSLEQMKAQLKAGEESTSSLQVLYTGMQSVLNLSFQMKHIDYTATNLVHADMSWNQFQQAQAKNRDNILALAFQGAFEQMKTEAANGSQGFSPKELLKLLHSSSRGMTLKVKFAQQLADSAMLDTMQNTMGQTIIRDRNIVAIRELKKQLRQDQNHKIAIFFGAGHLPDMEQRLLQLGFQKENREWLVAWNMVIP